MTLIDPLQYPWEEKYFCWYPVKTMQGKWHWFSYVCRTNYMGYGHDLFGRTTIDDNYTYYELSITKEKK